MARTPTTIIPLGFKAPDFNLPNVVTGEMNNLLDCSGTCATVVVFMCNHCPFVIHILEEMVAVAKEFEPKGINFIAISSNDVVNYPDDSPKKMKELAMSSGFPFPYLYDESQDIAKSYSAACTPDFSVFDNQLLCVYRGQFDDARPGNDMPVTGSDLRRVLHCIADSIPLNFEQVPSLGCNIKWK